MSTGPEPPQAQKSETELETQTMEQHHSLLCLFCHQDIKLVNTRVQYMSSQRVNGDMTWDNSYNLIFGHLLVLTHPLFQRRYHIYTVAYAETMKESWSSSTAPIKPMGGDCWLWTSLHHQRRGLAHSLSRVGVLQFVCIDLLLLIILTHVVSLSTVSTSLLLSSPNSTFVFHLHFYHRLIFFPSFTEMKDIILLFLVEIKPAVKHTWAMSNCTCISLMKEYGIYMVKMEILSE